MAALRAFEAVGRLGGVRRAARELTVDHAVVSRHIRSLEGWVGVQLIARVGNQRSLTEQGEKYHREISQALMAIAASTGQLIAGDGAHSLRLTCIPGFATLWVADRLGGFIAENPELHVDFRPSDEAPDFRGKDVDCDIRYLRDWDKDSLPREVKSLEIVRPAVFPVASPDLLAELPPIETLEDLLRCPLLHEDGDDEWKRWLKEQGVAVEGQLSGPRLWHAHLTLNSARHGRGVALANNMLLGDALKRGELVVVKPAEGAIKRIALGAYVLLAREDRWNAPAVLRFRRWIRPAVADYQKEAV
nr:LysR substrate-binding domain-containing protein [Novosphingobium sp. PC22D]